jgi:peptidoglycan-associated lipoprotein
MSRGSRGSMTRRPTARISSKLAACLAAGAFAVACTSTPTTDESADTGSEFQQGDQSEIEVVEDVEVSVAIEADLETVYFEFDRYDIRTDARTLLRTNGDQLRNSGVSVRLEGHADERGDEEYNLALGERRATAVKRYLEDLGVASSKMRTVSYGESRPAVKGHNESAWRYNRRVEALAR